MLTLSSRSTRVGLSFLVIFFSLPEVSSYESYYNVSEEIRRYLPEVQGASHRDSRFLRFSTSDKSMADLEFRMAFFRIPVKLFKDSFLKMTKEMNGQNMMKNMLKLASGLVDSTTGKILLLAFNPIGGFWPENIYPIKRTKYISWDVTQRPKKRSNSMPACLQKIVCSLVKSSAHKVKQRSGTSKEKIIDGLSSSEWILDFFSNTSLRNAIDAGRNNSIECKNKFSDCLVKDSQLIGSLVNLFLKFC